MNAKKIAASAVLLGGLSACGTLLDLAEYDNIETELLEAEQTVPSDMPMSGGATFTGKALGGTLAYAGASEATHAYIGDATIDVAFAPGGGTVGGEITNLTGVGPRTSSVVNAPGSIDITAGVITGSNITATYTGDLSIGTDDLSLNGTLDGAFYGSGPDGVMLDSADGATVNGVPYLHGLYIVAN